MTPAGRLTAARAADNRARRRYRAYLAAVAFAGTSPAGAQVPSACAPRAVIIERLADLYGEARIGAGLQNASQMLELYAAPGGTWTALITRADGIACIVATGTNWFRVAPAAPEPPGEDG